MHGSLVLRQGYRDYGFATNQRYEMTTTIVAVHACSPARRGALRSMERCNRIYGQRETDKGVDTQGTPTRA